MKIFNKSQHGSVSLFLIIVFAVIFFLHAVLIDYARVMAFKKQTEIAVKGAIRSVLSNFDTDLQASYGLYGLDKEKSETIFYDTLQKNLSSPKDSFQFINIKLHDDSVAIDEQYPLSNHHVFKQQILEDMKYKAPIDLTIDIIDNFKGFSGKMNEASKTVHVLKDLDSLYTARNELLKKVSTMQTKNISAVKKNKKLESINKYLSGYADYLVNKSELASLNSNPEAIIDERLKKKKEQLQSKISEYKNGFLLATEGIYEDFEFDLEDINQRVEDGLAFIEEAENINKTIEKEIERYQETNSIEELKELLNKEDLVLQGVFFVELKDILSNQKEAYYSVYSTVNILKNKVNALFTQGKKDGSSSIKRIRELQVIAENSLHTYFDISQAIEKSNNQLKTFLEKVEQEGKEAQEKKAGLEKMNVLFHLLDSVNEKSSDYQELENYFNKYTEINNLLLEEMKTNTFDTTRADDEMEGLFSDFGNVFAEFRDDIYVNEYAFNRFNSFDPTILEDFIKVSYETNDESKVDRIEAVEDNILSILAVENQEIEYIIYGEHLPGKNVGKAFRDIYLLRLAVNTLEGFFEPSVRALSHPLAILIGAIIYGVAKSVLDIIYLIEGQKVPFSKKFVGLKLGYRDYLRLLFLLHNADISKLSRIQALISYHTGNDLDEFSTYITGYASSSLELWFLPEVYKALDRMNLIDGNISGKSYFLNKKIVMSY